MTTEATTETITKDDLERSICTDSFFHFLQRFWSIIVPEEPVWNWHIHYLCNEMQKLAERVFKNLPKDYDLVINVPPGSTKSTICSIMFPAWVWTRMSTARIICGSYSYQLSMELSRRSRDVVESDKYQRLFGDVELRRDQNTKGHWANKDGGGRYSTSTGGTVTGFHGHFLIIDDPLNPEEAVSEVELKKANAWIGRTLSTRKVDKALTPTILIMQRLHEEDPSGDMIRMSKEVDVITGDPKLKIRHICLPAEIGEGNTKDVHPRYLRRYYTDGLLDPVRMSRKVLEEAQTKLLEYGYAGQFLQRPVPLAGGMFKIERIRIDVPPSSWYQRVRFWDKAGTEAGGAYTVGLLMGLDMEDRLWILDILRGQWDSGSREKLIKQTAQMDTVDVVVGLEQEPGSGGKESAENSVRSLLGFVVDIDIPRGDKVRRAGPFSTQVNSNNVYLAQADWNKAYINELALFPNGRFKDQVDASSGACSLLTAPRGRIGTW